MKEGKRFRELFSKKSKALEERLGEAKTLAEAFEILTGLNEGN